QLKVVGNILSDHGYVSYDIHGLGGRELGIAVARGLVGLSKRVGFPTTLSELPGFTDQHIERALTAAQDPQLEMKLQNMPVPLTAALVEEYMRPILEAAATGDFGLIKNMG
ncbi:MAG: iron-containing alcohol dehydrogenase, partial [Firmicutes bacterium]|nr:iron-containing alcohol dehydrogenase [Bacillota bacterium]